MLAPNGGSGMKGLGMKVTGVKRRIPAGGIQHYYWFTPDLAPKQEIHTCPSHQQKGYLDPADGHHAPQLQ